MIITLLTDFGLFAPYVGTMKGVILGIDSGVQIVDITHGIGAQNVDEAAFVLKNSYAYFPRGTIHLVVVDPGVGSDRAVLVVKTEAYTFVAPDNGVLKYVFDENPGAAVFRMTNRVYFLEKVSDTFHGRDIFAPVAAHLSKGVAVEVVGEPFLEYVVGEIKRPSVDPKKVAGEIVYIDGFGNAVTNIDGELLAGCEEVKIRVKSTVVDRIRRTYADVPAGEPLVLVGSGGTLEISIHGGSAKERIGFSVGDSVTVFLE